CPTCVCSACGSGGSTRATDVDCFFRNPVRQLRDFGASRPSVSVRRNRLSLPLVSRQPVTGTDPGPTATGDTGAGSALIGADVAASSVVESVLLSASSMAFTAAAGQAASA